MFQANTFLALLILCFSPFSATANQPVVVDVSYADGIYRASLSTHLNAKQNAVYPLLTAYDGLNTFSRLIYKSQLLKNGDLLINLRYCFFIICFDKQLTLSLNISDNALAAYIVPEHSDFKSGLIKWQLSDSPVGSYIEFSGTLAPDFWIPPIIGPILIKSKLRNEARYSFRELIRLTQSQHITL